MNLLLGSSGYLATNLLRYLQPEQTVTLSRSAEQPPVLKHFCLDLRNQLELSNLEGIIACRPSDIYIIGRPTEDDFCLNKRFYDNLKTLLLRLSQDPVLSAIHFFSTTLVYDGIHHIPSARSAETKPYSFYEYYKLDFELFLHYLSLNIRPDIAVWVYRLPILFGGVFSPEKNLGQFLYGFIDSYARGVGWRFSNEEDKKYGTAWAFTPSLCQIITCGLSMPGFHLRNTSSGFFTYFQLHELLSEHFGTPSNDELKLHRSYFNIDDELGLPRMEICEALLTYEPQPSSALQTPVSF